MTLVELSQDASRGTGSIPASIFRAYDIRGLVDKELSPDNVRLISQAIGSEALDNGIETLLVGFDGRLSSPILSAALIDGLLASGCNVVRLGLIPTPLLYFATHTSGIDSGVMLTASHNPADYNGLKIVFKQTCLGDNQIQLLRQRIERGDLRTGHGELSALDLADVYKKDICSRITIRRKMRVVVDCGNAVAGTIAPELFEALGCEVIPLFCEVDGSFPNHHPDPTVPDNLSALAQEVVTQKADLGIAFDGDGDRLGMVTDKGEFIDADLMLMLLIKDIAPRYPGQPILFDVKCSKRLAALIERYGAVPIMHRSGHSFMKQKMQKTGAALGGEFAAHIFIKDNWWGFDDGIYAAARVVEILSNLDHSASEEFADYRNGVSTPELKLTVPEEDKFALMDKLLSLADFPDGNCITLDGLRVEFNDGWGLVRASNTSPALLFRFEADDTERLADIQARFKALIHAADKSIQVDF